MPTHPPRPGATPRRDFLKLAALVPAVAAGGATSRPAPGAAPGATAAAPATPPPDGLAALRAFPLDPAAEPAFVFRARGARGRGP